MKLFSNIKGDLFGGITAGIVALPLALAFGVQSGLGASAGLYGAIAIGLIAAIFGGTLTQISGPTGPMTVVSASIVALAISKYGGIENGLALIILTFFVAGLFQILFGVLKIGKYIKYIPYPVLSGFMSGIGVIIIVLQIFPMMGLASPAKIVSVFHQLPQAITNINIASLIITLVTIALIYLFPKITKAVPGTLVALVIVSVFTYLLKLNIPLIGEIPAGLPGLKINLISNLRLSDLLLVIAPAITLAGLGAIDTLLTSVVADNITKTKHNSDKELIGQGLGNMAAALIGGIPGAGATMRTVVNVKSGGRTRLSGVIHAVLLLLILLGLGRFVAYIPLSVLAGVLITVGISIVDAKGLRNLLHIPRTDAVILVVVLLLTVFIDLLQAVGIGMVIASFLFMKRTSDMVESNTQFKPIKHDDEELPWKDEKRLKLDRFNRIYIKHLDGPLFFGAVSKFSQLTATIPDGIEVVVIRMKRVPFIDQSGLYAMENTITELQSKGIIVLMTMVQDQPMNMMKNIRIIPDLIPKEHIFSCFTVCSIWLENYFSRTR